MNSAVAAIIGLAFAIYLIIKKLSPVYSLFLGALTGGLLSGCGLETTVLNMIGGVKDIAPAIVRIIAAGVLSGALIKTGAAASISRGIIKGLGPSRTYLAMAFSTLILSGVGVFVDVAVITVAPIALMAGSRLHLSPTKLLIAMTGGAKCGNIMSPNPNTIVAADNYGAHLSSVMGAGVLPGLIGLLVTVFIIVPLMPSPKGETLLSNQNDDVDDKDLPSFLSSIAGPVTSIVLMGLRPLTGIVIDPLVALPAGGIVTLLCTGKWREGKSAIMFGLEKMSGVAILLIGTGTIAGVVKASSITEILVAGLSGFDYGAALMAPVSSILMAGATASTTAGATISSSSFAPTILAAGISPVWAAAMTNAGATVIDSLPFGSFFHTTGGSMNMEFRHRMFLIPFEACIGLVLTVCSITMYFLINNI